MHTFRPSSLPLICLPFFLACAGGADPTESGEDAGPSGATGSQSGTGGLAAGTGGSLAGGGSPSGSGGGISPECTNVRPTGTEWDEATCDQWASETPECQEDWMVDNNYCNESCGRCSGSSAEGSGGSVSGAGGGTIVSNCSEGSQQVCDNDIGTHCGYTYEYWKDQGTGCLTNTDEGFSVEWNNINNLLGRKGIRPGSANHVVNYSANYNPSGNSYLCVYGWSQGPLAEYYIVDSWGSWRPPGGEGFVGTMESDGGTYDIYRTTRVDQPSIEGNATFDQYWSVRQDKRESGTVTVKNHFDAWASHGMNMGSIYEVSMTVEGYQSSGSADVTLSIQ